MINHESVDIDKINFQIEEDIYAEFKQLCEENFDTPSAVMRAIVHDFIEYAREKHGDRW